MTLEKFTIMRRDELLTFFKERFGKHWRQIVARQTHMHPRSFQRWKDAPPLSLYRQIHKLETWARTIGFQAATDAEVQEALREHANFKQAAAQEVESANGKRCQPSPAGESLESHQIGVKIAEGMRRLRDGRKSPPTIWLVSTRNNT
jgi:hypothetical protein